MRSWTKHIVISLLSLLLGLPLCAQQLSHVVIDAETGEIHLHFLPNNQQDFGFRGDLYILKDSTYHVRRCELTLPKKSDVNFVETGRPSKVDIGPVNTLLTHNFIDGYRVRGSAQTTASLHPHLFLKGYVAHGIDSA